MYELGNTRILMYKSIFAKIRKYRIIILIALAALFILLIILGYTMNPDKTWKPYTYEHTTQSR